MLGAIPALLTQAHDCQVPKPFDTNKRVIPGPIRGKTIYCTLSAISMESEEIYVHVFPM